MTVVRYIKSDMMMSLDDDVIDETCERFHIVPDGCSESYAFGFRVYAS